MLHCQASIIYNKFKSAIAYDTIVEEMESAGDDADALWNRSRIDPDLLLDAMEDRLAIFGEKFEFDDEFSESLHMNDMMQFCLVELATSPSPSLTRFRQASKLYSRLLESATAETSARMQVKTAGRCRSRS